MFIVYDFEEKMKDREIQNNSENINQIYNSKIKTLAEKYFLLIIGMTIIFWAFAFPFISIGLEELSPVNLTIMRLMIVCIFFIIILILKPKKFSKFHKKDFIPIFLLGFFGIITYHLCLNYGQQYVSPSVASLIIATIPIYIVIFAVIFLKEKITLKIISGIILSLIGVVIISSFGSPDTILEIKYISGAFAIIIAALGGAGYTIAGKKLLQRYSALSLTVYAFLIGSIGLIPFVGNSLFEEILRLSIIGWGAIIFLAFFSTVIGYIFWYIALEIRNASEISIYLYFIPVLSTIISYFWLNVRVTIFFILGGVLVIIGLIIVNRSNHKAI